MISIKISSKYRAQVMSKLHKVVDGRFEDAAQIEVIEGAIKPLIKAGVSPVVNVDGKRRFAGYKDPKSYPDKKKAKRPVNLFLTGELLSWYVAWGKGAKLFLGIPTFAPEEVKVKAVANNEGTVNKKGEIAIAARRFIPIRGELFTTSVMRKLKNLYARRIKDLVSNK